jgi:rhodanese-related sulfurtransferase
MYYLANLILLLVIAYQIRTIYLSFRVPNVIPEEIPALKKELKNKLQIIDLRTYGRFNKKNIKGSKHIPIGQFSSQIEKMSPDKKYILITQNGTQTGRAVKEMIDKGYDAFNLKGGFRAWNKYQKD